MQKLTFPILITRCCVVFDQQKRKTQKRKDNWVKKTGNKGKLSQGIQINVNITDAQVDLWSSHINCTKHNLINHLTRTFNEGTTS